MLLALAVSCISFSCTGPATAQQVSPGSQRGVRGVQTGEGLERSNGPLYPRAMRFAFMGDFGDDGPGLAGVAALIHSWRPEVILTAGDNNYPDGEASTIDANIGKHFHEFIHPYQGAFGSGAAENRFFPTIGNHDWEPTGDGYTPYLDYFELPGNERYYDYRRGPVHFFCVNSDMHEPDGRTAGSVQGQWFQERMAESDATYKVVVFHHAPYSSGLANGGSPFMRWPFRQWGADLVLTGHDHHYERFWIDGLPMLIDGRGGRELRVIGPPMQGSLARFNADHGATIVQVEEECMIVRVMTRTGVMVDQFVVTPEPYGLSELSLVKTGEDWRYVDDGSDLGTTWTDPFLDDMSWSIGPSQLGYGDGDEATVVDFGGDPNNVHPTTYFRRLFAVNNPILASSLELRVKRDDGAVIYLNGTEVYRTNMDPGPVDYLDFASGSAGATEDEWFTVSIDPGLLLFGRNCLAAEVHQSHADSPDLSFDAELTMVLGNSMVSDYTVWRYLDSGAVPSLGWRTLGHDDSSWSTGAGQFGYGEGDEDVILDFGADPMNKPIANYFRTTFDVVDPDAFDVLLMSVKRDDGVAVWINGQEVYRANLPTGALNGGVPASYEVTGADEDQHWQTTVSPHVLRAGTNVIAVEVHQDSPASDDMSFQLRLTGH